MIELRPVNEKNRDAVCALRVSKEQESFVADNEFSLGQAELQPACVPLAVYTGDEAVGFVMYALDPDDGEYWIDRVMIDRTRQGRGYGRAAVKAMLARIGEDAPGRDVYISFEPGNTAARSLYASLGFLSDHWSMDGEEVWCLRKKPLFIQELTPDDRKASDPGLTGNEREQDDPGLRAWAAYGPDGPVCGVLTGRMDTAEEGMEALADGARYFTVEKLFVAGNMRGHALGKALFLHARHVLMAEEEAEAILVSTKQGISAELKSYFIRENGMTSYDTCLCLPL